MMKGVSRKSFKVESRMTKNREPSKRSGPHNKVYSRATNSKRKPSPCRSLDFDDGGAVSLNEDVLMEILVRLPVKSVIRFKLVCKSWLSYISSDQFRRLHTLRRHKPPRSFVLAARQLWNPIITSELRYINPVINEISEKRRMLVPFGAINVLKKIEILSCSNGLMLLRNMHDHDYCVYNPATEDSKKLIIAKNDEYIYVVSLHLLFDPSVSPHYKIVCIRAEDEPLSRNRIEIFDSESGAWRVCVEPFASGEITDLVDRVRDCKSSIYLTYRPTLLSSSVYCFDTVKNVSEIIVFPEPERPGKTIYSHSLQESNGSLYYCALLRDGPCRSTAALWELQVNGDDPRRSKWSLRYEHEVHSLPYALVLKMVTFITETSTVLIHVPGKIVAYNFPDKSYKELLDLEPGASFVNVHQFGETLALL